MVGDPDASHPSLGKHPDEAKILPDEHARHDWHFVGSYHDHVDVASSRRPEAMLGTLSFHSERPREAAIAASGPHAGPASREETFMPGYPVTCELLATSAPVFYVPLVVSFRASTTCTSSMDRRIERTLDERMRRVLKMRIRNGKKVSGEW